ncbi:MAG: class E sortase [Ilumatobacteraceae bacterium]
MVRRSTLLDVLVGIFVCSLLAACGVRESADSLTAVAPAPTAASIVALVPEAAPGGLLPGASEEADVRAVAAAADPVVALTVPAPATAGVSREVAAQTTVAVSIATIEAGIDDIDVGGDVTPDDGSGNAAGTSGAGGAGTSGKVPSSAKGAGITIEIPKIGLSQTLLEGVSLSVLDRGLGHWPGTAMPGQRGNMVIAGHRVSHGHVFRDLDQLSVGDRLIATTGYGTYTYQVTGTQIVDPTETWIVGQGSSATATLFACHPKGSTKQRIVVFLALA